MADLTAVTSDLPTIVNNLLKKNIINEWMKNYILVRNVILIEYRGIICDFSNVLQEDQEDQKETIKETRFYKLIQGRGPEAFAALCRVLEETNNSKACEILTSSKKRYFLLDTLT